MLQIYATPAYASETKVLWNTPKVGVHRKLHAEDLRRNIQTFLYGRAWTTSSIVERRRKQVSKQARNNFLNPKLSFPMRTRNVTTEFTLFFNADKVT